MLTGNPYNIFLFHVFVDMESLQFRHWGDARRDEDCQWRLVPPSIWRVEQVGLLQKPGRPCECFVGEAATAGWRQLTMLVKGCPNSSLKMLGELWCSGLLELGSDLTSQAPGLGQDLLSSRLREGEQEIGVFEGREKSCGWDTSRRRRPRFTWPPTCPSRNRP